MTDTPSGTYDTLMATGAPLVPWPTTEDVFDWALANDYAAEVGEDTSDSRALQMALNGNIAWIAGRFGLCVVDPNDADREVHVDAGVAMAVVLYTAKTYFRKDSHDGVQGSDQLGGSFRAGRYDPDAERLLANVALPGLA